MQRRVVKASKEKVKEANPMDDAESEPKGKGRAPWAVKETLIAIPFLASALAMTWESL